MADLWETPQGSAGTERAVSGVRAAALLDVRAYTSVQNVGKALSPQRSASDVRGERGRRSSARGRSSGGVVRWSAAPSSGSFMAEPQQVAGLDRRGLVSRTTDFSL